MPFFKEYARKLNTNNFIQDLNLARRGLNINSQKLVPMAFKRAV